MNLKQTAAGVVLVAMMVAGTACSNDKAASTATPTPAATATATAAPQAAAESQDSINLKGYIAGRIAQEKVNTLFAEKKTKDGAFKLNPVVDSKEKAVKFLTSYIDAALADKLAAHYITDKKDGADILTNKEPFFPTDVLTTTKADITFDAANTNDQVKFTTKDGVTFTTKKVNDQFVLVDVAKK